MANILSIRENDTIVESVGGKKSRTVVTHIVFNACSKRGVHINRNACYDNTAEVTIERGAVTEEEIEDFDTSDLSLEELAELVVQE
jgi:hypothetical protein